MSFNVTAARDPGGHVRWLRTDRGWRVNLGKGLDTFQQRDGDWFDFSTSRKEFRQVRAFGDADIGQRETQT